MSEADHKVEAHKATKDEVKQAIALLLSGVSSDPSGVAEFTASWWKRLMFKHSAGPRAMGQQMDTFVVPGPEGILGYLSVQLGGSAASAFEWGVTRPLAQADGQATLRALLDAAMAKVEDIGGYDHFYVGLMADQAGGIQVLESEDFYLADYQLVQMTASLPLALPSDAGSSAGVHFVPKLARAYKADMERLLRLDYPGDTDAADTAAAMHLSILGNPKIMEVELDVEDVGGEGMGGKRESVGFLQFNRYKDEQRVLYALAPRLWGTETEMGILRTALAPYLGKPGRLRLRTFSRAHLAAIRPALEALGLTWAESVWRRYVVAWEE